MDYENFRKGLEGNKTRVCIVGLGYVGLPLALGFAESGLPVLGFDVSREKIGNLRNGTDPTGEIEGKLKDILKANKMEFTTDPKEIRDCSIIIICVPTPIKQDKSPELKYIESAGISVGKNLKENSIVVLESTVYPGATEGFLKPIIERESGMKSGEGFSLGYSPERINPGDKEHSLGKITKVVSGSDRDSASLLKDLYSRVARDVYLAEDIKTAEAAKVIENIQRDLNIALMNELAIIFRRMGINIYKVLEAAGTKWNFHKYYPGMVGGHCIGIDPYYLVYKAKELGYEPEVILAGRKINDYMPVHVASLTLKGLEKAGKRPEDSRVLLLGLTFKKNVSDLRNTPARTIIDSLKDKVKEIVAYDPVMLKHDSSSFGITIVKDIPVLEGIDCIVMVTDHDAFKSIDLSLLKRISGENPVLVDARGFFDPGEAEKSGFIYLGI